MMIAPPNLSTVQFAGAGIDSVGSGYDAVRGTNKRRTAPPILRSEDDQLRITDRKKMLASSQLLYRNFALVRWMVARHLDYVSTFTFQAKTGNRELNKRLEWLVRGWSKPGNFEVSDRFSRQKFVRMAELQRTLNGDVGVLKLRKGKVQAIEGDRVRTPYGGLPDGYTPADFIHGVRTNDFGKHLEYSVCKRGKFNDAGGGSSQFQFERIIPARNMLMFGYLDRFDQVRGISPLAAAMNSAADAYESFDYALARQKIAQLLGVVFTRKALDEADPLSEAEEDDEEEEDTGEPRYGKIEWGGGTVQVDLDQGDDMKFIESHNPTTEAQAFWQVIIQLVLKALDIPYSFYSENFSNYSGARQALLQYENSAKIKRMDLQELQDHLTWWRCMLWIQDGCLPGVAPDDLRWEWVPNGLPWIDPLKEAQAKLALLAAGLTSRGRILRESGDGDNEDLLDELQAEEKSAADRGLKFNVSPIVVLNDQPEPQQGNK